MPGVSIVIPAYNAEKTIAECLSAVKDLDWDGEIETILINDGSTDNTVKIASAFTQVQVINIRHCGEFHAINIGIQTTRHDIVALVESDVALEKEWLRKVIPYFEDPTVAAVGGHAMTGNKRLIGKIAGSYSELRRDRIHTLYVDHLSGANTAYRRQALLECKMFDSLGDVSLNRRLSAAGYRLIYSKEAICKHYWQEDLKSYFWQQRNYACYRLELAQKFKNPHDQIAGLGMIFQVPFVVLVVLAAVLGSILSPFALLALVLLPLIHIRDAASILLKKKDLAVALALPFLFTLRNFIWIYAVPIYAFRQILGQKTSQDS